jgi:hypothetical protein
MLLLTFSVADALTLAACGSGTRSDAGEPGSSYEVAVTSVSFPAAQRLSAHTHLVIAVRNLDTKTIPNIAVTICNVTCAYPAPAGEGTSAGAFAADIDMRYVANPSRPAWIVDRAPGPCGYSCQAGGPGAAVSAYANTWALGALAPGRTARFDWAVTAVSSGHHVLGWVLTAGLAGNARAVLADGATPRGSFTVAVKSAPQKSFVSAGGRIVRAP